MKNIFAKIKNSFKKLTKKKIILILIVLAAAGGAGWYFFGSPQQMMPTSTTTSYIRTTTLSKTVLEETISSTGSVSSNNTSNVSAETSAIISEIYVSVGDYVEEGQTVITLEQDSILEKIEELLEDIEEAQEDLQEAYDDALEAKDDAWYTAFGGSYGTEYKESAALSALNTAKATLTTYQSAYNTAVSAESAAGTAVNTTYNAYQTAYNALEEESCDNNGTCSLAYSAYTSAQETYTGAATTLATKLDDLNEAKDRVGYTALETAYNTAVANHEVAFAAYLAAENALTTATENLEGGSDTQIESLQEQLDDYYEEISEYTLTASTSGTVTSVNATVGASSGSGTLVVIEDTEDLIIEISVDESDIKSVVVGLPCNIYSDATTETITGEVISVSPVASSSGMGSTASTFTVTVAVNNGSNGLLIGMNAQVDIILSQTEGVYAVPIDAIEEIDGVSYVYKQVGEDEFELMEVTVGQENNYYVEITGENVVDGVVIRSSANLEEATSTTEETTTMPGMDMMSGEMSSGMDMQSSSGQMQGQMGR